MACFAVSPMIFENHMFFSFFCYSTHFTVTFHRHDFFFVDFSRNFFSTSLPAEAFFVSQGWRSNHFERRSGPLGDFPPRPNQLRLPSRLGG